jgi:hypothetical protein
MRRLAILSVLLFAAPAAAEKKPEEKQLPGDEQPTPPAGEEKPPADQPPAVEEPAQKSPPNVRLRRIQQRIGSNKEQIWRDKTRIGLLTETGILPNAQGQVAIVHENKMGGSFRLLKIVYALDGQVVFSRVDDTGKLHETKRFEIYRNNLLPGNHTVSVLLIYRGHGYGVFEYLRQYRFTVRSSYTLSVPEGQPTSMVVVGYEKGGVTTPLEKRPAVDYKVKHVGDLANEKPPKK